MNENTLHQMSRELVAHWLGNLETGAVPRDVSKTSNVLFEPRFPTGVSCSSDSHYAGVVTN